MELERRRKILKIVKERTNIERSMDINKHYIAISKKANKDLYELLFTISFITIMVLLILIGNLI